MNHPQNLLLKVLCLSLLSITTVLSCFSQNEKDSIDAILRSQFNFSPLEIAAVTRGLMITKELQSDNRAEVAVCGAVYIPVPIDFADASYRNIEALRIDSDITAIGRFSVPPELKDLDSLTLEEEDVKALRKCSPGHCTIKMSRSAMKRFRKEIDWDRWDYQRRVLSLVKDMLIGYTRSYLAGGNDSMGVYDDQTYSLNKAEEFEKILKESPGLLNDQPGLFSHLESFPRDSLPGSTDIIYWQKEKFEKIKPVLSLNHVTIYHPGATNSKTIVTTKQIYANHFFEASLVQIVMMRDTADSTGFYALYLRRSCFDDLRKAKLFDFSKDIHREIYQRVREEILWTKERILSLYAAKIVK